MVKNLPAYAGDLGSIPGWGRSPGGGHGNPLQDSCLENPMDRGSRWSTVHGVAKSWTRLSNFQFHRGHSHSYHARLCSLFYSHLDPNQRVPRLLTSLSRVYSLINASLARSNFFNSANWLIPLRRKRITTTTYEYLLWGQALFLAP